MALERGLAKLPADRFLHAADFARALADDRHLSLPEREQLVKRRVPTLPLAFAVLCLFSGFGIGIMVGRRQAASSQSERATTRFAIAVPLDAPIAPHDLPAIAISPDGRRLVYTAETSAGTNLLLREMAGTTFVSIPGTEGALGPFFSPNGEHIGFFAGGKLRKVAVRGGAPTNLAEAVLARGGHWAANDTILFTSAPGTGLWAVSANGGVPRAVTTLDTLLGERTHRLPTAAGNGRFLATTRTGTHSSFDQAAITLFDPGADTRRAVFDGGSQPRLLGDHVLLFFRANVLNGVRIAPGRLAPEGQPVALIDSVMSDPSTGAAHYAVSDGGTLVYVSGTAWVPQRAIQVGDGASRRPLVNARGAFREPRVSNDGSFLAIVTEAANDDIWIFDLLDGSSRRLTFESGSNVAPTWSPNGEQLAFSSNRSGRYNVYIRRADGIDEPRKVTESDEIQFPSSWSPDSRTLAITQSSIVTGSDIWLLDVTEGILRPFLVSSHNEFSAVYSPDNRWIAYVSDESGQEEIYLERLPQGGGKRQVSAGGGTHPRWDSRGSTLYYRNGSELWNVRLAGDRPTVSAPSRVMTIPMPIGTIGAVPNYDVNPQGNVIVIEDSEMSLPTQIQVVVGWWEEVMQRIR